MNPKSRSVMLLVPLIAMLSVCGAFAAVSDSDSSDGAASLSGTSGGCAYSLADNVLTISPSGNGQMADYTASTATPWKDVKAEIVKILIEPGVVKIGNFCFADLSQLHEITLSSSVTSIGSSAFESCTQLREIIIPSSVTSIGSSAFKSCIQLREVIIPSSVTSISDMAFIFCTSLNKVYIPSSVTSIGGYSFASCVSLKEIVIPSSVTSIGTIAFRNCDSLESIVIPEGVTDIPSGLFLNCRSLSSVIIPSSVTSIDQLAFQNCVSLTDITIPSSVTWMGHDVFTNAQSLRNITFAGPIPSMGGSSCFDINGYSPLNITMDPSASAASIIRTAGDTVITVNEKLPTFDSGMSGSISWRFDGGVLTLSVDGSAAMPSYSADSHAPWYRYAGQITSVIMDSGIRTISDYAFYNCCNLKTIAVSSSLISVGGYAFNNCYDLTSIDIPYGVSSIGDYAFQNCYSLKAAGVPGTVSSIGNYAFQNCYSLMAADFKCGLKTIGDNAFQNCYSLKDVSFPPGMRTIGPNAFGSCYDLDSVIIPTGLTEIGGSAFNKCYSLVEIDLPSTIVNVRSSAFADCIDVGTVRINSNKNFTTESDAFAFNGVRTVTLQSFESATCVTGFSGSTVFNCVVPGTYVLKFGSNDSVSSYADVSSLAGSAVYLPDAVQDSTGYVLEGWYHKETGKRIGGPGDAYTILLSENGWTVHPVFMELSQRITCDPDNGKDPIIVNIPTGSVIKAFPDVSKEGYTFAGWYIDRACTVPYIQALPVDSDLTLYAGWSADIVELIVPDEPDSDAGIIAVAFCVIIFAVFVALSRRS